MGIHNIKFETEVFQQGPVFGIGGITPVETKPDISILTQLASQLGQLTATVNQLTQFVAGQAFTRAAPQASSEALSSTEEIRKLTQRLDELEARAAKPK